MSTNLYFQYPVPSPTTPSASSRTPRRTSPQHQHAQSTSASREEQRPTFMTRKTSVTDALKSAFRRSSLASLMLNRTHHLADGGAVGGHRGSVAAASSSR